MKPKRWQLLLLSVLIIFGMAIYILPIPQSKIGDIAINIGFTGTAQAGILEFDIVIPTGSTNADTYMQDALDRLPAEGGQLKLWDISITTGGIWIHHDYIWQDATTVTRAIGNVTIIGMGASTIINSDGNTSVFKAGGDGWLIKNINFGNNTNAVDKNGFDCMVCECWVNGVWVNDCASSFAPGNMTLTNSHILVGNATNQAVDVAMTGDVSIDNTGLTAIANDSHDHTGATLSGIDISGDTNLGNSSPITLIGDTIGLGYDTTLELNVGNLSVDQSNIYHNQLGNLTWSTAGHTINADVDFAKHKAIAMVCDNGTTLPTAPAPVAGQWFLHTPTGRKILYQYDGLTWMPIITVGAMTVYVDKTNGTDAQGKGYGSGANAYKTIQYAINQIPPLFSGDVTIYVTAETYAETVTIKGKQPTGNYTIYIYGTYAAATDTGTCGAGSSQGTGATQATVVDDTGSWGVNSYANKLVVFGAATTTVALRGDYSVIDSNTADTLTLVGCLDAAPVAGDTFTIYDYGTQVNRFTIQVSQTAVQLQRMELIGDGSYSIYQYQYSRLDLLRCKITDSRTYTPNYASMAWTACYGIRTSSSYLCQILISASLTLTRSKINVQHDTGYGVQLESGSYFALASGSIIDGYTDVSHNASYGIYAYGNDVVNCYASATGGYPRIRNFDVGVYSFIGSQCMNFSNNQYSGNTVDVAYRLGGDEQYIQLKEQAGVPTSTATYGYLYVDNGTPNDLWWEDDAGNTEQLSAASACFLFLWDKTTRRIAAVQTYASWDTVPVVTGGFITVLKKQWDLTKYEYKLYPPQSYAPPYQTAITSYTEDGEPIIEQRVVWNSITIDSLGLRDFTPAELAKATYDPAKEIATLQSQVIILNTAKDQSQTTIESLLKLITELEYRIKVLEDKLGVKP